MAPPAPFQDDDALADMLDSLIENAKSDPLLNDFTDPDPASIADSSSPNPSLSALVESVEATNDHLLKAGLPTTLPIPSARENNIPVVLAASLSALSHLAQSYVANVSLRQRAESSVHVAHAENERLLSALSKSRDIADARANAEAVAKRAAAAAEHRHEQAARANSLQVSELRSRLVSAGVKEKALLSEARKRDKELALLRHRVHAIIAASSNVPILPVVTVAAATAAAETRGRRRRARTAATAQPVAASKPADALSHQYAREIDESAEMARAAKTLVLEAENERFRDLLLAVHEELDDLLVIHKAKVDDHELAADIDADVENRIAETSSRLVNRDVDAVLQENTDHLYIDASEDENSDKSLKQHMKQVGDDECPPSGPDVPNGTHGPYEDDKSLKTVSHFGDEQPAPPITPSADQMRLPFEMIREEFEEALEQKFRLIRDALT